MSWSTNRRMLIIGIIILLVGGGVAAILFPVLYVPPSCMDGKQNGTEGGVDCGGTCTYLCSATLKKPSVRFARPFSPSLGRTDVIAYVENQNTDAAAKNVRFTIEIYGKDGTVLARKEGVTDLPPGVTVPVYVPSFSTGYADVARAFLLFDEASVKWYRYTDSRIVPKYNYDAEVQGDSAPRVWATLTNPSAFPLTNVMVIATVFDSAGNAIAASQNVIPSFPRQGVAGAVFTWNNPFTALPARIDIIPIIPLPTGMGGAP